MATDYKKMLEGCKLVAEGDELFERVWRTRNDPVKDARLEAEYGKNLTQQLEAAIAAQPEIEKQIDPLTSMQADELQAGRPPNKAISEKFIALANEAHDRLIAFCKAPNS